MYRSRIHSVDLHGFSWEAALREVERQINHTFCQEEDNREIRFITGWGGVLRPRLKTYLAEHILVKEINLDGPSVIAYLAERRP